MNQNEETRPNEQQAETRPEQQAEPAARPAEGLPQTQEELDDLIERRLARERRRLARQTAQSAAQTDQPPAEAQPAEQTARLAQMNRELLVARAQLDAWREGIVPGAVEDAVHLAVMAAEKAGEADEEGVRDALKEVLQRHPEWKAPDKTAAKGGFRVGVDTTGADAEKPGARKKALPTGRVVF